jgi:hypothetical protein
MSGSWPGSCIAPGAMVLAERTVMMPDPLVVT